jgi:hypothetical protein
MVVQRGPTVWLFRPFAYIAGTRALALGLAAVLATGFIASLSNTHFDGVLDIHTGRAAPVYLFLIEGIIDWLSLALVLFVLGRALSKTAFRAADVFGTQALARWPALIAAVAALAPPYQRLLSALMEQLPGLPTLAGLPATDLAGGAAVMLLGFVAIIWMIVLMYQAYVICCNLSGGKAIASFIAGLIVAEVISKVAIYRLYMT